LRLAYLRGFILRGCEAVDVHGGERLFARFQDDGVEVVKVLLYKRRDRVTARQDAVHLSRQLSAEKDGSVDQGPML
jgi:hypothetical protein